LPRYEKFDLRVLWIQHNEHRVLIPELIYIADDMMLGAHEYLPIVLSALFQAATFGILGWVIWSDRKLSVPFRIALVLTGGVVLGWPGIAYVLSIPFLMSWTLVQLLVGAALLSMTRGRLAWPIACGVIATFSSGHGMLLWPVLLLSGLMLRIGWTRLAAIALTGAASALLYFYRLVPGGDSQGRVFLHDPSWFFGFLSSMLSMPFSADRRILGLWLGPAGFVLFGIVLYVAWRRRLLTEAPAVVLFGVCIFSLLTVLVCGMGRTLPTYWDYPTAKVGRYLSVPVCYWAALFLVSLWVLARVRSGALLAWTALAIVAGGMAYQFPRLNPWLERQFDIFARQQSAVVAMESGVTCDSIVASDLYPHAEKIREWNAILKQRRLSVYSAGRFQWTGRSLSGLMAIAPGMRSKGGVTTSIPFACAMQLAGWLQGDERELLLVNEKGIVAGLGRRLPAGLPLYLPNRWAGSRPLENWTGFVNYALASETIQPYVVLAGGRSAAPLGTAIPVPPADKRSF
jgi:hypothetical protein